MKLKSSTSKPTGLVVMAWTRFSRDQLGSITYACNTRMLQGQKENWVNCNGPNLRKVWKVT